MTKSSPPQRNRIRSISSATIHKFRQFVARHQRLRGVDRKTYVFILVPFDLSEFGWVKRAEVAQPLINGHNGSDVERHEFGLSLPQRLRVEVIDSRLEARNADPDDEAELDFSLMRTWFLPNRSGEQRSASENRR
jgi:hypothetical protein